MERPAAVILGGLTPRPPSPTELSDQAWDVSTPLVPEATPGGHPAAHPTRELLHGLCSRPRRGCARRLLPHDLPPWRTVDEAWWPWRQDGRWPLLQARLRGDGRGAAGTGGAAALRRTPGQGRPRHRRGETCGLLLAVVGTAASGHEREGAQTVLAVLRPQVCRRRRRWAEPASAGTLVAWVQGVRPQRPVPREMGPRPQSTHGVPVLPQRGVVERPLGWCNRDRRGSAAAEDLPETRETRIRAARLHGLARRLARMAPDETRSEPRDHLPARNAGARPAGVRAYIHMLKTRVMALEATTQWVRDQV
jgi:putative transposase